MFKLIKNLLCFANIHDWEYNKDNTKRWCKNCGEGQEYWGNIEWCTCIDGEPIMKDVVSEVINRLESLRDQIRETREENKKLYNKLLNNEVDYSELKEGICKRCDFQKQYFIETKKLLDEKKCLNKIIDNLLKSMNYPTDVAGPHEFKVVYKDIKDRQKKLREYREVLEYIKERCNDILENAVNHSHIRISFVEEIKNKIDEIL